MASKNVASNAISDPIGALLLWTLGGEFLPAKINPVNTEWMILFASTLIPPAVFLILRNWPKVETVSPCLSAYWPALGVGFVASFAVILARTVLEQ